jgi:hypothetical protein
MPCFRDPEGPRAIAHAASKGESLAECRICGGAILPATAARTNGRCMRCVQDPYGPHRVALHAARTTTEDLLASLERLVVEGTLRLARHAVATFGGERIYGFWLFLEYFAMYGVAVLTETTLDAALARDGLAADSPERDKHRWDWEYDATHYLELDDKELALAAAALEHKVDRDSAAHSDLLVEAEKRVSLRALRRVREEAIFEPHVVLTLAAFDLSLEEAYAYAELFCDPSALEAFRRDADLREDYVRLYRERIQRDARDRTS